MPAALLPAGFFVAVPGLVHSPALIFEKAAYRLVLKGVQGFPVPFP